MRASLSLAGVAFAAMATIAGTTPAAADTLNYTLSYSGTSDDGPMSEFGPAFNPAMGTLTNVSFAFTGTYTPSIVGANITNPQSTLFYTFGTPGGGGGTETQLGTFTLDQNGRFLTGAPETFSFSIASVPFLADYLTTPGYFPTAWLGNVDVFSQPTVKNSWGNPWDDNSIYSGSFNLTYTYTVPEPSSAAMLALGLCAVGIASTSFLNKRSKELLGV